MLTKSIQLNRTSITSLTKRYQSTLSSSTTPQFGHFSLPPIRNEPVYSYSENTVEYNKLQSAIQKLKSEAVDIPIIINGKEIRDGKKGKQVMPSNHSHTVATFTESTSQHTHDAINCALHAKTQWESLSIQQRSAIFLKAADLLSHKYRYESNAACILGQGKNMYQAEIDSAAEQCDFWRYNVKFANDIYNVQPPDNSDTTWNRLEYRSLEGFILAITPFNFTAIGSNLASAPVLMGNVSLWKPSSTALLSNYVAMKIMREAGVPDGVINFLPSTSGVDISTACFAHSEFAGLHFTGSTNVFKSLWSSISDNLTHYRSYPRIVGETGGKNFHFVHESADPQLVIHQTIRGAFEYAGQKCSATSRAYMPKSLWHTIKDGLITETNKIISTHFGQPDCRSTFVSAVIDDKAYKRLSTALDKIKSDSELTILAGGKCDNTTGYFIEPTIVQTSNPKNWLMKNELFGPIICIYVYDESNELNKALELCDTTAEYGLTGAIFARDRYAIEHMNNKLIHSAGNFYINDKSTGAIVGQQPFGGARGSGTNDKAGSHLNLLRWVSARTIKETSVPITHWSYPYMNVKQ